MLLKHIQRQVEVICYKDRCQITMKDMSKNFILVFQQKIKRRIWLLVQCPNFLHVFKNGMYIIKFKLFLHIVVTINMDCPILKAVLL